MGIFSLTRSKSDTEILQSKGTDPATIETSSHEEEYDEVVPLTIKSTSHQRLVASEGTEITMSLPRKLDKYGFIVNIDSSGNVCETNVGSDSGSKDRVPAFEIKRTERREAKWQNTLKSWDNRRPKKTKDRLRKGLPDSVRGQVWLMLVGGIRQPGLYQEIVQKTSDAMLEDYKELASRSSVENSLSPTLPTSSDSSSPVKEGPENLTPGKGKSTKFDDDYAHSRAFRSVQDTIERDIHRTFPRHNLFYEEDSTKNEDKIAEHVSSLLGTFCDPELASIILNLESDIKITTSGGTSKQLSLSDEAPGGQAALRRVLRAYSFYDREVGYCQGMNFIAGMFLTFMSEEEAFWLLVGVMHEKPCRMRGMFGEGMRETHKVLHVAERLIHLHLPRLARHFDKEHVHVTMYATQWLLTQYTSSFKFDLVTRVWDSFLVEGWKIIYRVMLALLMHRQAQLLKMSFEDILAYFRELPELVDGRTILETALKIPLKTRQILRYEKEWQAQQPSSR